MTPGFRTHYDKPLQYFIDEELKGYSNVKQATREAKQRLRSYANLFLRDMRKVILTPSSLCVKCGSTENLCLDHIIPITKGGKNEEENLQVLCRTCNIKKGNKLECKE